MAKVIVSLQLKEEILRKFKHQAYEIFTLMKELENHPKKGKIVGQVSGIIIKEIKYNGFRFYAITDGHTHKFGCKEELASLLIKFIKMSAKKDQKKIISNIKKVLRSIGFDNL